jgi:hypothetical protein
LTPSPFSRHEVGHMGGCHVDFKGLSLEHNNKRRAKFELISGCPRKADPGGQTRCHLFSAQIDYLGVIETERASYPNISQLTPPGYQTLYQISTFILLCFFFFFPFPTMFTHYMLHAILGRGSSHCFYKGSDCKYFKFFRPKIIFITTIQFCHGS